MDVVGFDVVVAPGTSGGVVVFILLGAALGTVSGLTPGIHANNFALFLAVLAPAIPGPPAMVGAAMLSAGVVHTFLDIVPAIGLGVPDADMVATALPGHRLVLEGRGREALRLSALGSGLAVVFAVPLGVPITLVMLEVYPRIRPHMSVVLIGIALVLVVTERSNRGRSVGAALFAASAVIGLATLDRDPDAILDAGGMLAPLFAGLFGAPVLLDSIRGAGVPKQTGSTVRSSPRRIAGVALVGTIAGALVGYLPAVSSAIAAILVLGVLPAATGDRGFIVATSGVNTANTVFALFALVALGTPRTGVLVAIDSAGVPLNLPLLVCTVAAAASIGFVLVTVVGDRYLEVLRRIDYARLSLAVLGGLLVVSYLFAGSIGVLAFLVCAALGLVPPRFETRRVHLMGVLMGPLILR